MTFKADLLSGVHLRTLSPAIKGKPWIPPYEEFLRFLKGGVFWGRHRYTKRIGDGKIFHEDGTPVE